MGAVCVVGCEKYTRGMCAGQRCMSGVWEVCDVCVVCVWFGVRGM